MSQSQVQTWDGRSVGGGGIRRAEVREERREIWKVEAKEGRVLNALGWRWWKSSTGVSLVEQSESGYAKDADQAEQYDEQNEEKVNEISRVLLTLATLAPALSS